MSDTGGQVNRMKLAFLLVRNGWILTVSCGSTPSMEWHGMQSLQE